MNRCLLYFVLVLVTSCQKELKVKKELELEIDKVDLEINRFDNFLFSINEGNVEDKSNEYFFNDSSFWYWYESVLIQQSHFVNTDNIDSLLVSLAQHKDRREVYDSISYLFEDFSSLKDDLDMAFSRFQSFFPNYQSNPVITTVYSDFLYDVQVYYINDTSSGIAISLETFLGSGSKFYPPSFNGYMRKYMHKKYIVSKVMEAWFEYHFSDNLHGDRDLASQIISQGKMLYFLDKMIPGTPLYDRFRF